MPPRIILASGSPRRHALLNALGVDFEVMTSNAAEFHEGTVPAAIVEANARAKRDDVAARLTGRPAVVIAADTLVFLEEHVLPKPADRAEAFRMLRQLSGNTHQVVTGLALVDIATGRSVEGSETTNVTFRNLDDIQIRRFIDMVNPVDRAGAYTVDGPGSLLVARYGGCYHNVLGLPIVRLDQLLRRLDIDITTLMDPARTVFL